MRFIAFGFAAAALAIASTASAAGGGLGGGSKDLGPKPTPPSASGAGQAETPSEVDISSTQLARKESAQGAAGAEETKPWEVGATFETHRLIRQEDLGGAGSVKVFNVLYATAKYDITDKDRALISGGALQYFLADQSETGYRATDISLGYSRLIPLPQELNLRATATTTIPVSFYSQLASNITSPSLTLALSRRFGDLSVQASIVGGAFIDRYTTSAEMGANGSTPGAQPNPKWRAGAALTGEYSMPFHRPLSAGLALTDSYIWYYDVGQCPSQSQCLGASSDPQFPNGQPMQQSYGGEIFVRYTLPELVGMKSDITLALANGDPSLGYPSVLHDGVVHPYILYRQTAELYAALSARY
jgi:hypothetical protein